MVFRNSAPELFREIEMMLGVPELRVPLPGRGRASQTDLFVLGKSGEDLVSITVEGKVAEPFDDLVSVWLSRRVAPAVEAPAAPEQGVEVESQSAKSEAAQAPADGPSAGKQRRLAYLCEMLGLAEAAVRDTRYQLLHRTVSALILAETFNARHALMLVHSFSQTREWLDDYRAFASLLGVSAEHDAITHVGTRGGVELYLGWVTGDARWLEV